MNLAKLIRGKNEFVVVATAIHAIPAIRGQEKGATVARIATVAVASPTSEKTAPPAKVSAGDTAPLTAEEETVIRAWLALIEETDSATITEVIERCQRDADALDYFNGRAAIAAEPIGGDRETDDGAATKEVQRCVDCRHIRRPGGVARYCGASRADLAPAYGEGHPLRRLPADDGLGCWLFAAW